VSTLARTLRLLLLTVAFVGCDSSAELEECVPSDEPEAAPGSRRNACLRSVFQTEDLRAREVRGLVRRGEDVVPGATVRVESTAGFETGKVAAPASTVTDAVGVFGGLRTVALRYDLLVKLDRPGASEHDVMLYRGLGGRYIEPSIEGPRTFARAWTSRVDVALDRAVPTGHSLAFFASGDGVYSVMGDLTSGLSVLTGGYSNRATVHVLEYETAGGFEKATSYGKAEVGLDAGSARRIDVALEPITKFVEPKFAVTAPAGFVSSTVEIRFGFTRTSDGLLASVPVGSSKPLPIIPNAGYTYQVTATAGGAVSDTGETGFDVLAPLTAIELPDPPIVAAPLDGEARAVGETLLVDGEGVFEHVLVPQAGGASIRIVTGQRETAIPDVTSVGATRPVGPYTWTVRSYPTTRFPEALGGVDSRRYRSMGVSRSRSIVLR
jgi:hypothetical protein